jgi:hypothetical protein
MPRPAERVCRQDGAGGEVGGDRDDVGDVDSTGAHRIRHRTLEDPDPVRGILQGPVCRQPPTAAGQLGVDHRIRVVIDR